MPKRSIDAVTLDKFMPVPNDHHKVHISNMQPGAQRSHEENQERAYIAASRRADRSIEACVRSARTASDIHKKRTGKGFRITEEIVAMQEMYEEEDEKMPRSYRLLSVITETSSADMNARLEAYISNKVKVYNMLATANDEWRDNEINRLFARSFPNAALVAQQMTESMRKEAADKEATDKEAADKELPEGFSATACPSISCSSPARIAEQDAPISASIIHHGRAALNRRGSCASVSLRTKSRRNGVERTSSAHTEDKHTTRSFNDNISPRIPSNFASLNRLFTAELPPEVHMLLAGVGTETSKQTQDHQKELNPPIMYDPIKMFQTIQNGTEGTRDLPNHCGNEAKEIIAFKHLMSCIPNDDDPWQSFFNDSIWAMNY